MPSPTKRLPLEVCAVLDSLQRQINDQGSKIQAHQELLWVLVDTHPNPTAVLERFRRRHGGRIRWCARGDYH